MFTDMVMDGAAERMGEAGVNSSLFADESLINKEARGVVAPPRLGKSGG
jgi:hypothetical protein